MVTEQNFLVPLETYLKSGLHIGTKSRTKYMDQFIYKIRPDGLSVLNIQTTNSRIDLMSRFLSRYKPEEILIVCKRENGWNAVKMFSKMTGIRAYAGRYHPGILTNAELEDFIEIKVLLAVDPWPDKDAIRDAVHVGAVVVSLCDTNNESNFIDVVVPCNNKGKKSLGLVFWILAREYMKNRGMIKDEKEMGFPLEQFMAD